MDENKKGKEVKFILIRAEHVDTHIVILLLGFSTFFRETIAYG